VAWAALYIFMALKIPSMSDAVILAATFSIMFIVAVFKDWFKVSKKLIVAASLGIAAVIIMLVTGIVFSDTIADKVLFPYQTARLRSVFGVGGQNENYTAEKAFEIMSGNSSFSFKQKNLAEAISTVPELGTDYTIVGLTAAFGSGGTVFVIMLILIITGVSIRIVIGQRDEFGKILGLGCSLVFLWETVISVLMALNIIPSTMALVPFISQGGSQILVMYILMGIVMSVQRYRNVAVYEDKKTAGSDEYSEIKIAGYKVSLEKQR
jgi:cell division protein FtsW (lipid II flippase)